MIIWVPFFNIFIDFQNYSNFYFFSTIQSLAPEYIYTKQYDYSSDMFSLGCVLFQIYAKQKLFNNQNNILNYKQNIENINNLLQASNSLPYELQGPFSCQFCLFLKEILNFK